MKKIEINLIHLEPLNNQHSPPSLLRRARQTIVAAIALFLIAVSSATVLSYQQSKDQHSPINRTIRTIFSGQLVYFGQTPDKKLQGEDSDRINILLLGIGGKNHDGPYLSDTNIILSVKPSQHRMAIISIPRDLVVPMEGYGWRKINNADAFGELQGEGKGLEYARSVFSSTLDVPIDYTIRIDFSGFSKIVDRLGGLPITVDRAFTDYTYPTDDYKFQTVSFTEGPQLMDGERALQFTRSRHSGMNNEGSDFARSKRQQKILFALKDKIFSAPLLLQPQKISEIINTLRENIYTDIQGWEILKFALVVQSLRQEQSIHFVFDDSADGYLVPDNSDGAFVLRPRDGTFQAMREKIKNIFDEEPAGKEKNAISLEQPSIIVKNGTLVEGLATQMASAFSSYGFTVTSVGNHKIRNLEKTLVVDFTKGAKRASAEALKAKFGVQSFDQPPEEILVSATSTPDFLVILGADSQLHLNR